MLTSGAACLVVYSRLEADVLPDGPPARRATTSWWVCLVLRGLAAGGLALLGGCMMPSNGRTLAGWFDSSG